MRGTDMMQKQSDRIEAGLRIPKGFRRRSPRPHYNRYRIYTPEKAELPEANIEPISTEARSILYR